MLNLHQRLAQQLKLLPQQIQYQKLLQLNSLNLEMRIQQELDQNPILEEELLEDAEPDIEQDELKDSLDDVEVSDDEKDEISEFENEYSFDEYINDDIEGYKSNLNNQPEDYSDIPAPNYETLVEHLKKQLVELELSEDMYTLGEEILGNLDSQGYLKLSLEDIVKDLELFENILIPLKDAEKLLSKIQHFDPIGIASRSLTECLIIQLDQKNFDNENSAIAARIIKECLEDLLYKKYEQIESKLGITKEQIKNALQIIHLLDPKPGEGNLISTNINQITPDLIVEKIDEKYHVFLNDKHISKIRINKDYYSLYHRKKRKTKTEQEKQMHQFLKEKIDNAKWFIDALSQRKQTLLRVMYAILDRQIEFFEKGVDYLRPMVLKDIADLTKLDISTISRVVNGKFVQSSIGIHELKYFFSEGLETENGVEISNKNVKMKIEEMVKKEDKSKPLTDDEIADKLKAEGIKIARRTIAKYRDMLGIPVGKLRREL